MTSGRHQLHPPDDVHHLNGEYHVGRYFLGMFPHLEQTCPCPKARCGLAIPVTDTPCPEHHHDKPIRQHHHQDDCHGHRRRHRRARRQW